MCTLWCQFPGFFLDFAPSHCLSPSFASRISRVVPSFREITDLLLFSGGSNFISKEEFLVLWQEYQPANLTFPHSSCGEIHLQLISWVSIFLSGSHNTNHMAYFHLPFCHTLITYPRKLFHPLWTLLYIRNGIFLVRWYTFHRLRRRNFRLHTHWCLMNKKRKKKEPPYLTSTRLTSPTIKDMIIMSSRFLPFFSKVLLKFSV